jgi:NADH-quinone oxidoreductase subunit N
MLESFKRSYHLAVESYHVLRQDPELLVFPVVSFVAMLVAMGVVGTVAMAAGAFSEDGFNIIGLFFLFLFYLVTYGFATVGAFAIVSLVRDPAGEATALNRWAGLGREAPLVAGIFAFFLLAMAGIPLTSVFVGKWAVLSVALAAGAWPIVIAAVLFSVVAIALYIRVIKVMWFDEPEEDAPSVTYPSILTGGAIAVGAVATLVLGVVPGPVLDLAAHAGEFIR